MRIVVDNSGYHLRNMGDILMLRVAVQRLQRLFPDAEVEIPTSDVALLARYVGGTGLDARSWRGHYRLRILPVKQSWVPRRLRQGLARLESGLHGAFPVPAARAGLALRRLTAGALSVTVAGVRSVATADLVIGSGGGYLTDVFRQHAMGILDTLALAQSGRVPTALLGQGIGPLGDEKLRRRACEVLPRTELISLREGRQSLPLLRELGVRDEQIIVTGDDAIETAYAARRDDLGVDIGFNMRVARYASASLADASRIVSVLRELTHQYQCQIRALPIDWRDEPDSDVHSLRALLDEQGVVAAWPEDDTPDAVIQNIAMCRVIVTGSYHAGVFALAQGIPVVGLVRSRYYVDKFAGLAEQFGGGCAVVSLDAGNLASTLREAIEMRRNEAYRDRPTLLAAAQRQVSQSRNAYDRLAGAV